MALRLGMLKNAGCYTCSSLPLRRLAHVAAAPPPLDSAISTPSPSQPLELPEYYQNPDSTTRDISGIGFGFPSVPFSGSIELMAVPKKKVNLLHHFPHFLCTLDVKDGYYPFAIRNLNFPLLFRV